MKVFTAEEVHTHLDMKSCIAVMEQVLLALEQGRCGMSLRQTMPVEKGLLGLMPGFLPDGSFGAKLISVYHDNAAQGYPSHQGGILLFEGAHGVPLSFTDAGAITEIRTGAVSGLASRLLARKGSKKAAFLGAGVQAYSHLSALLVAFALTEVTVFDRSAKAAEAFATHARSLGLTATVCPDCKTAVAKADIINTLTSAHTPILELEWVSKGAHINAVGACAPGDRELSSALVAASRLYGDRLESVQNQSGDYLFPLNEGLITPSHFVGEIGQILAGNVPARQTEEEITIFEALGLAVEDLAAAQYLMDKKAF